MALLAERDDGGVKGVGEAAEGVGHAGETPAEPTEGDGDAAAGKAVWADNCAGCHGLAGTGGNGGPDLTSIPSAMDMRSSCSRR